MTQSQPHRIQPADRYEGFAWKWMRYSALLLIPLAWIHVLIQDIVVGGQNIDLNYVTQRWSLVGWRIYDFFLLSFAFAHGMNGLRQVLVDYVLSEKYRRWMGWILLAAWAIISVIGGIAIIGGVR